MLLPLAALVLAALQVQSPTPPAPPVDASPAGALGKFIRPFRPARNGTPRRFVVKPPQIRASRPVCAIPLKNVRPRTGLADNRMVKPLRGPSPDPKIVVAPPAPACDDGR